MTKQIRWALCLSVILGAGCRASEGEAIDTTGDALGTTTRRDAVVTTRVPGPTSPQPVAAVQADAAVPCASFCAINWQSLQFPGSVSIAPVVAAPFDPDLFPLFPPTVKLPKLFKYDTKEKCEALGQATSFVRGKYWFTSDELPDKKQLMVIKPELLSVPRGIEWMESCTETVDYDFKDYVTTEDLEDLEAPCTQGLLCPNSSGIYRNNDSQIGWSCVSDSIWGTDLLNKRVAVMCYPRAVDFDGYGPPFGTTAKVFRVRSDTPAPAYDTAVVTPPQGGVPEY